MNHFIRWVIFRQQVEYIASLAEIKLKKAYTTNKTRFSVWGQMFDVAVDLIEANREQELKFRLIYHGGWGTYYFEFYVNRNECLFALSEQGHIAGGWRSYEWQRSG